MPKLAIPFLLGAFPSTQSSHQAFINYKMAASLLKSVGSTIKDDMMADKYLSELFLPILACLKHVCLPEPTLVLLACLEAFTYKKESAAHQVCVSTWFGASLFQKQASESKIDLINLQIEFTSTVFKDSMSQKLEFLTTTAMESPTILDRIFSVMILTNTMKTDGTKIDFKAMTSLVLILLNDNSVKLRSHAINLAKTIIEA